MPENIRLWGPANTRLDFKQGTKIRIGNQSVVLQGLYYRDDDGHIRDLCKEIESQTRLVFDSIAECNKASDEKYPYDAPAPLPQRVSNIVKKLFFERGEKAKLLNMVAERDTRIRTLQSEISSMNERLRELRKTLLREAHDTHARAIEIAIEVTDAAKIKA